MSTLQPVIALNKVEDDYSVGQLLAQNLHFDTCIKDLDFNEGIYSIASWEKPLQLIF